MSAVPSIKFGLAFCEESGQCLIRWTGTNQALIEMAKKKAQDLSAGHRFIIFLGEGFYLINVLNSIKMVPEVCRIFCATANPTEVIVAQTAFSLMRSVTRHSRMSSASEVRICVVADYLFSDAASAGVGGADGRVFRSLTVSSTSSWPPWGETILQ